MRARGFTMIELALCVSILTILVPMVYAFVRGFENDLYRAEAEAGSAQAMRSVSEEVRRDLRGLVPADQVAGMELAGPCGTVRYVVVDEVLFRKASPGCGGDRPVARHVTKIVREPRALVVTFGRPMRPGIPANSSFRLAW